MNQHMTFSNFYLKCYSRKFYVYMKMATCYGSAFHWFVVEASQAMILKPKHLDEFFSE